MTFIHHHWWQLWAALASGDAVFVFGAAMLRRARYLGCRNYYRVRAVWEPISTVLTGLIWLSIAPLWLMYVLFGITALGEMFDFFIVSDRWAFRFVLEWNNKPPLIIERDGIIRTYQEMRRHRTHDDDCIYGPRKRPFAARIAQLKGWRKVSLNPVFAPA